MSDSFQKLQELYGSSLGSVRGDYDERTARATLAPYVDFVRSCHSGKGKLLDVGCGDGFSTGLLAESGFDATGLDLNAKAFKKDHKILERCKFIAGSALELPFEDRVFDVVACHQALEHMSDPERALREMIRVLKPGGLICVVGPNLLSLGQPLKTCLLYVWRNRPWYAALIRTPNMPRHPFGNTLFESLSSLVRNCGKIAQKTFAREVRFEMREPDLMPPFHADNDACYVCNPIDLKKYLESRSFRILRTRPRGRPPLSEYIVSGTWIAAKGPA